MLRSACVADRVREGPSLLSSLVRALADGGSRLATEHAPTASARGSPRWFATCHADGTVSVTELPATLAGCVIVVHVRRRGFVARGRRRLKDAAGHRNRVGLQDRPRSSDSGRPSGHPASTNVYRATTLPVAERELPCTHPIKRPWASARRPHVARHPHRECRVGGMGLAARPLGPRLAVAGRHGRAEGSPPVDLVVRWAKREVTELVWGVPCAVDVVARRHDRRCRAGCGRDGSAGPAPTPSRPIRTGDRPAADALEVLGGIAY